MLLGQLVAFGTELGDDALGVDEGLGAAERYKGDLGGGRVHANSFPRHALQRPSTGRQVVRFGQIGAFDAKSTSISWRASGRLVK
jgi:hypothetical protein